MSINPKRYITWRDIFNVDDKLNSLLNEIGEVQASNMRIEAGIKDVLSVDDKLNSLLNEISEVQASNMRIEAGIKYILNEIQNTSGLNESMDDTIICADELLNQLEESGCMIL